MSSIYNFLYRHKRKFLFGGGVLTSLYLLKRYATNKLIEWHNKEALLLISKQKRKQHFEKSKQTAQAAVLSMAQMLGKMVTEELNSEAILQALHQNPTNKQSLWEELKVVAFSQILCAIYLSALVVATIHVKLMVLSGNAYSQTEVDPYNSIQHSTQELYMTSIQEFMSNGVPLLIRKISRVVAPCVESLSLSRVVNIEQIEMILHDICLEMDGEFLGNGDSNRTRSRLRPWSQYCCESSFLQGFDEVQAVKSLLSETKDILDTEDFNSVMEGLVHHGLNTVLDFISQSFPQPIVNNNDDVLLSNQTDNSDNVSDSSLRHGLFTKSTLPVAKLIPIFSGSVHTLLSLGPGHLLQTLLMNSRLEVFSNNVYSAFCVEEPDKYV